MDIYERSVMGAYRLFLDADSAVEPVHEDEIEARGVPAHLKSLFFPMPTVVSGALAKLLAEWVGVGGLLVSESAPGSYDEWGWHRTRIPPDPLRAAFGVESIETDAVAGEVIAKFGDATLRGAWQREQLRLEGANTIGYFGDGSPAATRHSHGKGEAILIATCPSVAYDRNRDAATRSAIVGLFEAKAPALLRAHNPAPNLMTRRHRLADGRDALFVLNWTDRDQSFAAACDVALHTIPGSRPCAAGADIVIPAMSGAVAIG